MTSSIGYMVFKSREVCLAQKHPLKINYFIQKLEHTLNQNQKYDRESPFSKTSKTTSVETNVADGEEDADAEAGASGVAGVCAWMFGGLYSVTSEK